jgi:hypothetical protein
VANFGVNGAECLAQWWRGWWLVAGHERAQDAVVDLGVKDGEFEAVGGEGVLVAVGDAGDQPVAG